MRPRSRATSDAYLPRRGARRTRRLPRTMPPRMSRRPSRSRRRGPPVATVPAEQKRDAATASDGPPPRRSWVRWSEACQAVVASASWRDYTRPAQPAGQPCRLVAADAIGQGGSRRIANVSSARTRAQARPFIGEIAQDSEATAKNVGARRRSARSSFPAVAPPVTAVHVDSRSTVWAVSFTGERGLRLGSISSFAGTRQRMWIGTTQAQIAYTALSLTMPSRVRSGDDRAPRG